MDTEIPVGWQLEDDTLVRTLIFSDFGEAFGFMTQVAMAAEKADHHPNWSNVYNRVELRLCTHDAGNSVTAKDIALAMRINQIHGT